MDEVPFKPRAYERVAQNIANMERALSDIYKVGGFKALKEISGVGQSIAEHIEELIKTGKLKYYEKLKKSAPVDLSTLTQIEGLGPKKIRKLYQELGIKNLAQLEKAAKTGRIAKLKTFGAQSERNILKGIDFVKKSGGRYILGFVMPQIKMFEERLKNLKEVEQLAVAGSVRRRKETIGDIDILAVSKNPKKTMAYFVAMPEVVHVYAHGATKSSVKTKFGFDIDIRIIPKSSWGAALNYFTGSKEHNVALRELAIKKGWTLNEYSLSGGVGGKKGKVIASKTEEEIYKKLGLQYIEPELRELTGELDVSRKNKLPKLIEYGSLKGDLQVQTNWTDGSSSIEQMARAAASFGLEYIAITDHTKRLAMAHGLNEKTIKKQWEEIDKLNLKFKSQNSKLRILKGTECDILPNGKLDLPDYILKQLDVVGVSVHSRFNLSRPEQTARIIKAIENPNVDILFHPTCRIIQRREPIDIDIEAIIKAAKDTGTVLEIDAYPDRSDLKDEYIKKCVEAGVKLSIDSDAHATSHFIYLENGISQARRGWAEKKDIINAHPLEKMLKMLKH